MNKPSETHAKMLGQFAIDLGEFHHFSDGLYAKQVYIPAGYVVGQHAHKYSHLSILAKGRVILRSDEGEREFSAPVCIDIPEGVEHSIEALQDSVWFCIHATDETDPDAVDAVLIQEK